MMQVCRPYRLALVLFLSTVLILPMAPLAQAKATQKPAYPSLNQAKDAVTYYYNIISPFSEQNFMAQIDSITYGPIYGTGTYDRFGACIQYQFASNTAVQARHTARHIFTFQYENGSLIINNGWDVIHMDLNPC